MNGSDVALPPPLLRFLELYARGSFWESHEALEEVWREGRSDFYQALILYASAWVHWERHNAHGVRAQLRKTLHRLEGYPPFYMGFDVDRIRTHCEEVRQRVAEDPEGWADRISPLALRLDPARIRGDEVELEDGVSRGGG